MFLASIEVYNLFSRLVRELINLYLRRRIYYNNY